MTDILKHLDLNSADGTQLNLDALYQIAPSAFTEVRDDKTGVISRKVNFEVLRQLLGDHATDGDGEMYQFTWVGKNAARAEAAQPTDKTLRPVVEDSVDWDNTKNIYIEGDNLEVLKLLQRSYMGKVKMIYIDPPYNTGNDFVYHDDFARTAAEEDIEAGNVDELGYRFRKNTDTNGKFHSDWCSMIYSRLLVARSLLAEDGVIFISINDNEVRNLRNICDEVFGEHNFVADLIWTNKEGGGSSDSKLFRIKHEHILCYAKEIDKTDIKGVPISNAERYKGTDEYLSERGPFYLQKMGMGSIQYSSSLDYPIETPDGTTIMPSDNNNGKKACWRWSKDKFERNKALGFVVIKKDSSSVWTVYTKQYMNCDNEGNIIERTQRPMGVIDEYSSTQASKYLDSINLKYFDYSKPKELIAYLIRRIDFNNSLILDFFSGSATTAHAVMQLNAEDNGHRKFIMVQLPEKTDEKSEAYKAGYKTICEIGKERIRRAGKKIKEDSPLTTQDLDIGFRVLKCDTSNMKEVYYNPAEYEASLFSSLEDNIKEDRTPEDLLFQVMLDLGVLLSSKIEETTIAGKKVFNVEDNYLIACFDSDVTEETIKAIAKQKPYYFVMRDSSMANDSVATNFDQIFATYSPDTVRKVL